MCECVRCLVWKDTPEQDLAFNVSMETLSNCNKEQRHPLQKRTPLEHIIFWKSVKRVSCNYDEKNAITFLILDRLLLNCCSN